MDTTPYKLLIADVEKSTLLLIHGDSGYLEHEWSIPPKYTLLDICMSPDGRIIYIPTNYANERGALFTLSIENGLNQLPLDLPLIERFAVGPGSDQAILAARDGALCLLTTSNNSVTKIGRPETTSICVGLAAEKDTFYTVWQQAGFGVLAMITANGDILSEHHLSCIPTSLAQSENYLYIPYTAVEAGDEGLLLFKKGQLDTPKAISLQLCPDPAFLRIYPCFVAVSPDEALAYVIHEDSVNISIVDIPSARVVDHILVGRSISSLALLPDTKLAIAGSNMFADLSLIDLTNRRLLSLTDGKNEFFSQVIVIG